MNNFLILLLFTSIGAAIGYVTNWLAIWFLFHPKKPVKFLFWNIQGVFPKRQQAIAQRFSQIFIEEFLTSEMIQKNLFSPANLEKLYSQLESNVNHFLNEKLEEHYPLVSLLITEKRKEIIKSQLINAIGEKIADLSTNFESKINQIIDIQTIIAEKIMQLDTDDVNNIMMKILSRELKFIEISGAVLGGIIGLIQGFIALAIQ